MRGTRWIAGTLGLVCALGLGGCAGKQRAAEQPATSGSSGAGAEGLSTTGELDVGVSFSGGADDSEPGTAESADNEPPPTQTYSPANKLSPEEKAAANARD